MSLQGLISTCLDGQNAVALAKAAHWDAVLLFAAALVAAGCSSVSPTVRARSGSIDAINNTHWAINRFSVNGRNTVDIIGPYQGGGGACCFAVPAQWTPGMTVRVDWEAEVGYSFDFPGYEKREKYLEWKQKIRSQKRQPT